jgi:hypothetical protein
MCTFSILTLFCVNIYAIFNPSWKVFILCNKFKYSNIFVKFKYSNIFVKFKFKDYCEIKNLNLRITVKLYFEIFLRNSNFQIILFLINLNNLNICVNLNSNLYFVFSLFFIHSIKVIYFVNWQISLFDSRVLQLI